MELAPETPDDDASAMSAGSGATSLLAPQAHDRTTSAVISEIRSNIVVAASAILGQPLIKRTGAIYWSPNHDTRVVWTSSKRYEHESSEKYWYAYHPSWDAFLSEAASGYLAMGCVCK